MARTVTNSRESMLLLRSRSLATNTRSSTSGARWYPSASHPLRSCSREMDPEPEVSRPLNVSLALVKPTCREGNFMMRRLQAGGRAAQRRAAR